MTSSELQNSAIEQYRKMRPTYVTFAEKMQNLIRELLDQENIKYQFVESRAKEIDSFSEKIYRRGKSYTDPLKQVMDFCGCRIILYYQDDVDKAFELISREFNVLEEERAHQPANLDADRFGYLSLHLVVKLHDARSGLAEWKSYKNLCAEIQIRTVIQHAWSAVSHALQYKDETSVPSALSRRLYRIAGLFELADEEFLAIRNQRAELAEQVESGIFDKAAGIELSSTAIQSAIAAWDRYEDMRKIALSHGMAKSENEYSTSSFLPDIYDICWRAKINDVASLVRFVNNVNIDGLFVRFGTQSKIKWSATRDFLFFLILAEGCRDCVVLEDMIKNEWDLERAKDFLNDLRAD